MLKDFIPTCNIMGVNLAAINVVLCALKYAAQCYTTKVRYVEGVGKVVCRTHRHNAQRGVDAKATHAVHNIVDRAIAATYHGKLRVESILKWVDAQL